MSPRNPSDEWWDDLKSRERDLFPDPPRVVPDPAPIHPSTEECPFPGYTVGRFEVIHAHGEAQHYDVRHRASAEVWAHVWGPQEDPDEANLSGLARAVMIAQGLDRIWDGWMLHSTD